MSAETGGEHDERPFLSKEKPSCPSKLTINSAREWWCHACNHRVTVSANGKREWGHSRDCDHHAWDGSCSGSRARGEETAGTGL